MKWFKHVSVASDDPVIHEAISKFGPIAYWVYFGILELIASNYSVETPGKLSISWLQVQQKFRKRRTKLKEILNFYSTKGKLLWTESDGIISLNLPKFQDYTDEYTRKITPKVSGECPDNVRSDVRRVSGVNRIDKNRIEENRVDSSSPTSVPSNNNVSSEKEALYFLEDSHEIWRRSETMARKFHSEPGQIEAVAKRFYNAFKAYPEKWINEAYTATCDKAESIHSGAEGTTPFKSGGPGQFMLGILKKRKAEDEI